MSVHKANPKQEALYQELSQVLRKYADKDKLSQMELLAIGANMVGKLMALQDRKKVSREQVLEVVIKNIELGNQQAVDEYNTEWAVRDGAHGITHE